MSLPNLLVIGAGRSGATSLGRYLDVSNPLLRRAWIGSALARAAERLQELLERDLTHWLA